MNKYLAKIASYQEEDSSSFTHNGSTYRLNPLLEKAQRLETVSLPVKDMQWVLEHSTPDPKRVAAADTSTPLLVVKDRVWGYVPVDGLHRLAKGLEEGKTHLPAKLMPNEWLK